MAAGQAVALNASEATSQRARAASYPRHDPGRAPAFARYSEPRDRARAVAAATQSPPAYLHRLASPLYLPSPQRRWLGPAMFALKVAASTAAGALLALAVWQIDWNWVGPRGYFTSARAGHSPEVGSSARDRLARGWQAETTDTWPERAPPANWPRAVKTVKFLAPPRDAAAALAPAVSPFPSIRAAAVRSWRYQLQNINPAEIAKSSADLVVIDYASDGAPFSPAQVERMKTKPDGSRRIVLSYMSIGEAENYRWYWAQRSSSWLGAENRQWRGNYAVRFWDPAWQEIIFSYTDRILTAGFDGVYLDKVDEFETMGRRDDMVAFVARIAARAKAARPDFLVISQNGDQLLSEAKFRRAIDGFAREDLFYGEDTDGVRNSAGNIRESVARLKKLAAEGKPVFVVEYPKTDTQAQTARREISEQGFIGLIARRELGAL